MEERKSGHTDVSVTSGDIRFQGDHRGLLQGFRSLSGREMMERILQHENPRDIVQRLPAGDVYWMIKKLDEESAVMLLSLASESQWQYMLDLELWSGDRVDPDRSALWLKRLEQADCPRLVQWLFSEGQALAYHHFLKNLEVMAVQSEEDLWSLPPGCFTVDGVYYFRAAEEERPVLEHILEVMAGTDYERYQALVQGLAGVIPAELEEDMYRMRNVRIAEHGFLPREEALAVYAPLEPQTLEAAAKDAPSSPETPLDDSEADKLVPVTPLEHATRGRPLLEAVADFGDPVLLERIRLEFAGLCNQILSAEGDFSPELETLEATCERAAAYLNLALERLGGGDQPRIQDAIRRHSLLSLFRMGFGLALKLKWEADRWRASGWFTGKGLGPGFWGEYWGGVLAGLVQARPRVFVGPGEGEDYRDFERLSDLAESLKVLRRIMVLDSLLERLSGIYRLEDHLLRHPEISFRPLLFNFWARRVLGETLSFSPLAPAEFRRFFKVLRGGEEEKGPPYRISGAEEDFVSTFAAYASDSDEEAQGILREGLVLVWQEFEEDYAWVSSDDLDYRHSKFLLVKRGESSLR
ncbi:MAG: DUF6178 family protein [Desulfobacteraceae bacterium]